MSDRGIRPNALPVSKPSAFRCMTICLLYIRILTMNQALQTPRYASNASQPPQNSDFCPLNNLQSQHNQNQCGWQDPNHVALEKNLRHDSHVDIVDLADLG